MNYTILRGTMKKVIRWYSLACISVANATLADDSTFLCKQIDTDTTYIFTGTSIIHKDKMGNYGKAIDASFSYMPNGKTPRWSDNDGNSFILIQNQLIVRDAFGKVHGKIICE